MSSAVKRISLISMMLLLAAPFLFSSFFLIQQQLIKSRMKERIEQSAMQTITVKTSDISWVDKNEEALIEDHLFDVKSFVIMGNKTILTGLFDNEEDQLVAKMKDEFQQKKDSNNLLNILVTKFIAQQVLSKPDISFSIQNSWKIVSKKYPTFSQSIAETNFRIAIPPPKFS